MRNRTALVCGLCGALSGNCTNTGVGNPHASTDAATGAGAVSLVGTWNLTLAGARFTTTVTIGQDSLTITSPGFTVTATRTANVLTFTDNDSPTPVTNPGVLTATQTAGTFNAGILPFDLSGSWTMQAGPKGKSALLTCTLNVSATQIDGACQQASTAVPWFNFTTQKMSAAASSFGDFGGKWMNTWIWAGTNGGTFPCTIDFTGNSITTCPGGAMFGATDPHRGGLYGVVGSPLAGITFTYDGANTVSGSAKGWAEFSATR